jgi:hypothetical protein
MVVHGRHMSEAGAVCQMSNSARRFRDNLKINSTNAGGPLFRIKGGVKH